MMDKIEIYTDGSNSGYGFVVFKNNSKVEYRTSGFIKKTTNNEAEYMGIIAGLNWASSYGFTNVQLYTDSKLCVNQIYRKWRIHEKRLVPFYDLVKKLLSESGFEYVRIIWIPREKNLADEYSRI